MLDYSRSSLDRAIREAGYADLIDLLTQNPTSGYTQLAAQLKDVPPIVLIRDHLWLRRRAGETVLGLKESLLRTIHEKMEHGWDCSGREWLAVRLLSGWFSEMTVTCELDFLHAKLKTVTEFVIDSAEIGWLPMSVDDEFLNRTFATAELHEIGEPSDARRSPR